MIEEKLKKAGMKTPKELSNEYEFFRYTDEFFVRHHADACTTEITNSNFGIEFAHGAFDYGAKKMYIIYDGLDYWFINNGNYSTPYEVLNKIIKIKHNIGYDPNGTGFFGLGSTKITATRLGALTGLYTMKPNSYDIYTINYPSYFDVNNLNYLDWQKLYGRGSEVFVTRQEHNYESYRNSFPYHIIEHLDIEPTWAMRIRQYKTQDMRLKPDWSELAKEMNMVFVDKDFEFKFIDLSRKVNKVAGESSTLYFPTLPIKDKNGNDVYITSTTQLNPLVKKGTNQPLNFEYNRDNGEINIFKAYHYHAISKESNGIEWEKLIKNSGGKSNLFKAPGSDASNAYVYVFDHTGKYLWSFNAEAAGLRGVQYNYSNLVLILKQGQLEYNVIKTKGVDKTLKDKIVVFFKKYIDSNKHLQHNGIGKGENERVEQLRDIIVGVNKNKQIQKNLIQSLTYIAQKSGIEYDKISWDILEDNKNHSTLVPNPGGEIDWYIGKDLKKTILIEAMTKSLDLSHMKHFNYQLDWNQGNNQEVEIGILLIDGNPKSSMNTTYTNNLTVAQNGRGDGSLKAIWCISFKDFQNNDVDKFVKLDLKCNLNKFIEL